MEGLNEWFQEVICMAYFRHENDVGFEYNLSERISAFESTFTTFE